MFIDEGFFFSSLSICSKPFLKERSSDDSSHASAIINLLTELGMNITFLWKYSVSEMFTTKSNG